MSMAGNEKGSRRFIFASNSAKSHDENERRGVGGAHGVPPGARREGPIASGEVSRRSSTSAPSWRVTGRSVAAHVTAPTLDRTKRVNLWRAENRRRRREDRRARGHLPTPGRPHPAGDQPAGRREDRIGSRRLPLARTGGNALPGAGLG